MSENSENMAPVQTAPLTDWANEPKVSDLKQDYLDAASHHDTQAQKISGWLDNLHITGSAKPKKVKGKSAVAPKLIRKQAEWRYAALSEPFLSTEDIFNIAPVTFEDVAAAKQNALVLNNQFNTKMNKVGFIDSYVRAGVDEGTIIVRVGWESEEITEEQEVIDYQYIPTTDPAVMQEYQSIHQRLQADPNYLSQLEPHIAQAFTISMQQTTPVAAVPTGSHMEEVTRVVKNQPTVEVCDYRNVVLDPSCKGNLDKAGFIIYSFETSLSDLEKAGRYQNLNKINIETNATAGDPDHASDDDSGFNFTDKPRKKFVAYEYWGYWDIDDTGIVKPFVATYVGDIMIRMEENPFPDQGLPFVVVPYLPVRNHSYGEPDGSLLVDNQKIVGAVTRGMIDIMARSASGQVGSRSDALDLTNKRKMEEGEDYEFNPTVDPRQAFHMHTYPEIPQSAQYMLQQQTNDAEGMTGARPFGATNSQGMGDTATAARDVMDAASKREIGILRRLAQGMTQIGRKIISMNAEFLSEVEVVRVTNTEFVRVRRDDLAGNFDLILTISTAEADNKKAEELAFMLQTGSATMDQGEVRMIRAEIARLRKMPALAKRIEEYQPQPDPMAIKKAELEIALLEAQIVTERTKPLENQAGAQLDMAKVGTENAKAGNLASDTDLKNLDFVEQESGTKQERDLQKVERQAEAQTKMKKVEHNLKTSQVDDITTTNGVKSV